MLIILQTKPAPLSRIIPVCIHALQFVSAKTSSEANINVIALKNNTLICYLYNKYEAHLP